MSDTFFGSHRGDVRQFSAQPIEVRQRNLGEIMAIRREFDAVLERLQAARKEAGWLPITVSVPEEASTIVK